MKKAWVGVVLALALVAYGCSGSGGGGAGPEAQFAQITEMMGKGWEMSAAEREGLAAQVAEAKKLVAAGKKDDAGKVLGMALEKLDKIRDRHQLNNSE